MVLYFADEKPEHITALSQQPSPQSETRVSALWPAGVFLAALALFTASAAPEFLFDDNPEFIASAHVLGITHPPGYSLFSLLGKLFSLLLPGAVPLGVNLCSAFFGALGVALVWRALWRLTSRPAIGAAFAALFAVSPVFWSQAAQAEVYASNIFFMALLFNLTLELIGDWSIRNMLLLSLAAALAVINHYTALLALPVMAVAVIIAHRSRFRILLRTAMPALLLACLGLATLAYLPLRAAADPAVNWGDNTSAAGFFKHARGVETLRDAEAVTLAEKKLFARDYLIRTSQQVPWPWFLLFGHGIWALWRRRGRGALIAALFASVSVGFLFVLNYLYGPRTSYVVAFFYITSFMLLFVAMGLGAADLLGLLLKRNRAGEAAAAAVLVALVIWGAVGNAATGGLARNRIAAHYGRNMMLTLPRDAALFSPVVTESFPLAALRHVYGQRRDAVLYGKHGDAEGELGEKADPFSKVTQDAAEITTPDAFLGRLTAGRQVFLTMGALVDKPDMQPVLHGILYRLQKPDLPPDNEATATLWKRYNLHGVSLDRRDYDYLTRYVVTKYFLLQAASDIQNKRIFAAADMFARLEKFNPDSQFMFLAISNIYIRLKDFDEALIYLEKAMKAPPEEGERSLIPLAIYNNAGEFYRNQGRWEESLAAFQKAADMAPERPLSFFQLGRTYYLFAESLLKSGQGRRAHLMFQKALADLEKTARMQPDNPSLYTVMGICHEQLGNYTEAETHYRLAMDAADKGGDPDVFRHTAILYEEKLARPSDAIRMYEQYLARLNDDVRAAEIHLKLAQLYSQERLFHDALRHLSELDPVMDKLDPYHKTAAYYYAAISLEALGDDKEALHAYRDGVGAAYGLPDIYRRYGLFLGANLKLYGAAVDMLTLYLEKDPDSPHRKTVQKYIDAFKEKI